MNICGNCGETSPKTPPLHTFVCHSCSTINVDEDHYKEVISKASFGTSSEDSLTAIACIKALSGLYFDAADAIFIKQGRNKNAAYSASNDLINGLERLESLNTCKISADAQYTEILVSGLIKGLTYRNQGLVLPQLKSLIDSLLFNLLEIYDRNSKLVSSEVEKYATKGTALANLIEQQRPKPKGLLGKFFS